MILIGISIFVYVLLHAVFPSPAIVILGPKASPAAIAAFNALREPRGQWLMAAIVPAAVCYVVVQGMAWYVSSFIVKPNELVREQPYISHNIEMTRQAFGLNRIAQSPFPAESGVEALDEASTSNPVTHQFQDTRPYFIDGQRLLPLALRQPTREGGEPFHRPRNLRGPERAEQNRDDKAQHPEQRGGHAQAEDGAIRGLGRHQGDEARLRRRPDFERNTAAEIGMTRALDALNGVPGRRSLSVRRADRRRHDVTPRIAQLEIHPGGLLEAREESSVEHEPTVQQAGQIVLVTDRLDRGQRQRRHSFEALDLESIAVAAWDRFHWPHHASAVRPDHPSDNIQHGRLSGTVRADDTERLARIQTDAEVLRREHGPEPFGNVFQFQNRAHPWAEVPRD